MKVPNIHMFLPTLLSKTAVPELGEWNGRDLEKCTWDCVFVHPIFAVPSPLDSTLSLGFGLKLVTQVRPMTVKGVI